MCLATFNVLKAKDENGREIEPKYEVTDTLIRFISCYFRCQIGLNAFIIISHPKPFQYTIEARSKMARELILSIEDELIDGHDDAAAISNISLNL